MPLYKIARISLKSGHTMYWNWLHGDWENEPTTLYPLRMLFRRLAEVDKYLNNPPWYDSKAALTAYLAVIPVWNQVD